MATIPITVAVSIDGNQIAGTVASKRAKYANGTAADQISQSIQNLALKLEALCLFTPTIILIGQCRRLHRFAHFDAVIRSRANVAGVRWLAVDCLATWRPRTFEVG